MYSRKIAHETGHDLGARALVQLMWRAGLSDHAEVHHDDLFADDQRFGLVVRHTGHGQPEALLQRADLLAHRAAQPRIEVAERLVEEQHRRLEHERARHRHALLQAARQLTRQTRATLPMTRVASHASFITPTCTSTTSTPLLPSRTVAMAYLGNEFTSFSQRAISRLRSVLEPYFA